MDAQDSRTFDGEMTDAGRRELKDLEGQWKRVCVLGGSKGVGKDVVEMLSARDVEVVALVRREESKKELEGMKGGMPSSVCCELQSSMCLGCV